MHVNGWLKGIPARGALCHKAGDVMQSCDSVILLGGAGLCSRRALVSADIPVWMVKQAAHSDLQVLTANSPASSLLSLLKKLFISEVAITSMRLHTFYTGYPVGEWKRKGWRDTGL